MLSDYSRIGYPNSNQVIFLVTGRLTNLKAITEFMLKAQQKVGFDFKLANVICREHLQSAIDDALPGDIVVLPPGEHVIKDWGDLKEGGSIFGVNPIDPSLIELQTIPRRYGMEISNGATFENVVISSSHMTNNNDCSEDMSLNDSESIDLSNLLSERHGLLVKSGTVQMNNCTFLGLECAIKVMTNASIEMKKCKINLNRIGIMAEKNAKLTFEDVSFEGDTENDDEKYGIVIRENMVGHNMNFSNVSLRYDKGHFLFVDSGFFAKKQKKESVLYFVNTWNDVMPLLSKAIKKDLVLDTPALVHVNETSKRPSIPLKVVATLFIDNYDYAKRDINVTSQGDCGMIDNDVIKNELLITSSGKAIPSSV